ncbi:unnamed protein product [Lymnaea stagnalis]|uniref:Immunoglobulin V-set domain-containing protein n=1 Tax=Lymnaea stagnalis TaxID=6523 RepID=A0AAV2HD30_LYMST
MQKNIQISGFYIFKKDGSKNGSVLAAFRPCHVQHKCVYNLHFPAGRVWEATRVPPEHKQIHCNKDLDVSIFQLTLNIKDTMMSDAGEYGCRLDYCTHEHKKCEIHDCVMKVKVVQGQPITTLAEFPPGGFVLAKMS